METLLKTIVDRAERIGVIGSPSSTNNLTIDILGTASNKKLVGTLSIFDYDQDGYEHYALGQIVEIEMRNVWTQDPTMRGLIRQKGRVDPITERQDTHTATMTVSSVFQKQGDAVNQSILGTVPPTGTSVKLMNKEIMDSILRDYKSQLFYLGNAYGTSIPLPTWFKHFGQGEEGAGEAYHIGIFGKTGSGKSVLAKMILTAYSRHEEMSIFILDPQGEFAKDFTVNSKLRETVEKFGRNIEVYNVQDLSLTGWDLFNKILVNSGFLNRLGIFYETNRWQAAYQIEKTLKDACEEKERDKLLRYLYKRQFFDTVWMKLQDPDVIANIYSGQDGQRRVQLNIENADKEEKLREWRSIANLFSSEGKQKSITIKDLVDKIEEKKNLVIIDLSGIKLPDNLYWNEEIKFIVIGQFLNLIGKKAEERFKEETLLNGLVIIDEAHRLAPRERLENPDLEAVRTYLVDAVRTTRKFGLGWMFISQTLSSLHRDIINQIRIYLFGFGLGWGIERDALQEIIGGQREAMALYQ
ncbi:MAG: ATP-binding protein, partial [Candidatus Micrarchaeota archaeon]